MNTHSIQLQKEYGIIFFKYNNSLNEEEFEQAHVKLLEAQAESKSSKLLVNTVSMGPLSLNKQQRVGEFFVPKMRENTDQDMKIALLVGEDVFAKFSAQNAGRKVQKGAIICSFDKEADAVKWLKEA